MGCTGVSSTGCGLWFVACGLRFPFIIHVFCFMNWLVAISLLLCVRRVCAECVVQAAAAKADASGRRDSELRVMLCVRTDLGMKVAVQGLCFMFCVLCFSHFTLHVSRFTFHVSRLMFYISIFMPHPSTFSVTHPPSHPPFTPAPSPAKWLLSAGTPSWACETHCVMNHSPTSHLHHESPV